MTKKHETKRVALHSVQQSVRMTMEGIDTPEKTRDDTKMLKALTKIEKIFDSVDDLEEYKWK